MSADLLQDVRHALRGWAQNPLFASVAIMMLALGIGANTAIFSLINSVILRTLPVRNPERFFSCSVMASQIALVTRVTPRHPLASMSSNSYGTITRLLPTWWRMSRWASTRSLSAPATCPRKPRARWRAAITSPAWVSARNAAAC